MNSFQGAWLGSLGGLLLIAVALGISVWRSAFGILIDGRGRYSLTHFQTVLWTVLILSSALGLLISKGFRSTDIGLTQQLLGLMGISAGSAALATAVKGAKDVAGTANVAKAGPFTLSGGAVKIITPHLSQMWLEEEGDLADQVISITKYQNFIFTIVIAGVYVAMAWTADTGKLPVLPDNMVTLIGISHAGYVAGKLPDKK